MAVSADASTGESTRSLARPKSSSLASDLINMMLPEIARASRSKRGRKSVTGGEVLGQNLHSYGTTETAVAGTVDKDNHNHLSDCLKYLVLSLPAQTPLEVRLAVNRQMAP